MLIFAKVVWALLFGCWVLYTLLVGRAIECMLVSVILGMVGYFALAAGAGPLELLGLYASMIVGPVLLVGLVCLIESFITGRPEWPACGRCGAEHYRAEWTMGRVVAQCSCGAAYTRRGRQCLRVTAGGGSRAYMRWSILKGWVDERVEETERCAPYRECDGP